jgi:Na+/proline symporter
MLLLVMTGFCATYVKSLSLIVQPLAPTVPSWILGALFAALVSGVVIPGGLLSVVRSDVVSFVTTLLLLPLLLIIGLRHSGSLGGLAAIFPGGPARRRSDRAMGAPRTPVLVRDDTGRPHP